MKSIHIYILLAFVAFSSCKDAKTSITNPDDYNVYLNTPSNAVKTTAKQELEFWSAKLGIAPDQFPYLVKRASANMQLFNTTGEIKYLIESEKDLVEANTKTNYNKASYSRALARNYISQHRFKEALRLLKRAETNGERLENTQKMLFDVHLELGNYSEAQRYLNSIKKINDFDYLIRLSKWSDHKGDLTAAIKYMEKALAKAEATKNKSLMQWSYTNLADFYGHANRIEDSYRYYLKALALDPHDAYAKKGISWIVYSYERNPKEALRILDAITNTYHAPDYYLLKAEIAEFMQLEDMRKNNIQAYLLAVDNEDYGAMYNSYSALLFMEELSGFEEAFTIANKEITERPTPQSYDLLAWNYYNHGDFDKALQIVKNNIEDQTFEPEAQYHMAKIYKSNGREDLAMKIKKDLLESIYELGPVMEQKILQL